MPVVLQPHDALLVVDVQYDFLPGGALGVRGGDEIIPALNRYIALARSHGVPVFACRDWHPADHCSFHARGGPWPAHCVAGTHGAELHPDLALPADARIFSKATNPDAEAYSVFRGTDFVQTLRELRVTRLLIGGLATDYCVLNTALDARAAGFDVVVLGDAIRAVDAKPGDGGRALAKMRQAGAALVRSEDFAA
jgi:nicotinamidase/pyrazinamidase